MKKEDQIWLATLAIHKGYDFETLKYSDYLYHDEDKADDVWEYVEEHRKIGSAAFEEKYKDIKLFP